MSIEKFPINKVAESPKAEKVSDYWEDKKIYIIDSAQSDLKQLLQQQASSDITPESIDYEISRISRLLSLEGKSDQASKIKYYPHDDKRFGENINEVIDSIEPSQGDSENNSEFIKNRNIYILDETKNDLGVLYANFTKDPTHKFWKEGETGTSVGTVEFETNRIISELNLVVSTDSSKDLNKTLEALKKCSETDDSEEIKKYLLEAIHSF